MHCIIFWWVRVGIITEMIKAKMEIKCYLNPTLCTTFNWGSPNFQKEGPLVHHGAHYASVVRNGL